MGMNNTETWISYAIYTRGKWITEESELKSCFTIIPNIFWFHNYISPIEFQVLVILTLLMCFLCIVSFKTEHNKLIQFGRKIFAKCPHNGRVCTHSIACCDNLWQCKRARANECWEWCWGEHIHLESLTMTPAYKHVKSMSSYIANER